MQETGLFYHVHHGLLLEWCHSYKERVGYILTNKLKREQEIRLRLFQPVKGNLPQEVIEAGQAYDKAWQAHKKHAVCQ